MNQENTPITDETGQDAPNRTQIGFRIIGLGTILLLAGAALSMIVPLSHPYYNWVLYGPTSVGAVLVMYGFYCVFE